MNYEPSAKGDAIIRMRLPTRLAHCLAFAVGRVLRDSFVRWLIYMAIGMGLILLTDGVLLMLAALWVTFNVMSIVGTFVHWFRLAWHFSGPCIEAEFKAAIEVLRERGVLSERDIRAIRTMYKK